VAAKSQSIQDESIQAPARSNELLVRFRASASQLDKDTAIAAQGARRKKELRGESGVEKLELLGGQDVRTAALQLMLNPNVEFAEPNFLISRDQTSSTPNDSQFPEQWALQNHGQSGGQFGSDIGAAAAWQSVTGSQTTVIAVIDSGIDFTHPDLVNNQWINPNPINGDAHGWDFIRDSGEIIDEQGHGTAVAGIIAAEGNNATRIAGVMWHASLMSLRVLDNTGTGDIANAVEAIDYAASRNVPVMNLSWGTTGNSIALKDAIDRASRRGVVVVCSAGNGGQDVNAAPYYPASFGARDVIVVAATDNFDQLASWSNWGDRKVTIAAPGVNILTTQPGGGYGNVSGTSAAAPLVSGVVGLLKSEKPWLRAQQVVKTITDGARPVASLRDRVSAGGVVNAAGALLAFNPYVGGNGNGNGAGGYPFGGSAHGPGGTFAGPPATTHGVPGGNLPDLDQLRNTPAYRPQAKAPIESNLMCADCDPQSGGGGGGYYPSGDPNFGTVRTLPANETGQPAEDLGSQNFNWNLPLVSLPGRAGLDVNLTLYYNSLVWTKDGSFIKFNGDLGSPAPGFKLGLPTLQQRFTDAQTGSNAFIMVLPSGGRVMMRQVGGTNTYESQDSTYTQLIDNGPSGALVRTTDGTQFSFTPVTVNSEYRCTQIKDRNGNFVSASFNTTNGHLLSITDTLGRVVDLVYDGTNNLQKITQTWAGGAHDWVTFNYTEVYVSPSFSGLLVNGPNGSNVTVLSRVNLDDGSYFTFDYNAAFGQVNRINHYAPDAHLLSYTSYNLNSAAGQTDCPRFTERRDWAQNWNGDTDGQPATAEEAVTGFAVDPSGVGGWTKVTFPDGTVYKEIFETSGWRKGLTSTTKNYDSVAAANADTAKKWTTLTWTQDDENLWYQKNPRVAETNIYDDSGNHRRTTIDYTTYGLASNVREWTGSGGNTLYRTTTTSYRFDGVYLERRIIGLPDIIEVRNAGGGLVSRIGLAYDWDSHIEALPNGATATQHDPSYGVSFYYGRGNRVLQQFYDVNDPTNPSKIHEYKFAYNTNGQISYQWDPNWHFTYFSYTDGFSDGNNHNTFAYPTTVTDAGGFISTAQYNFDFGAITRIQTPAPEGQASGPIKIFAYASATARLERVTTQITVITTIATHASCIRQAWDRCSVLRPSTRRRKHTQ
jgi:subtilisin family serine protease